MKQLIETGENQTLTVIALSAMFLIWALFIGLCAAGVFNTDLF